ncbi:substrate-binding domain-containing protein [Robbsia sp. KACC 23696]|uniref:substrate-binding domain-containing protein n=1 Tax=Robbsia sp. KACC 23696 TaxID=3149231 RepID=UPI00325B2737
MSTEPRHGRALTGISSMATRALLSAVTAQYERETQTTVSIASIGGVDAAKRVDADEAFDIVVLASDAIARLVDAKKIVPDSVVDVVHSSIALAVKSGRDVPRIATAADVRSAVLQARSVGYSTGPSGVHIRRVLAEWGLTEDDVAPAPNRPRIVQARPGIPVGSLIADGEVDLGFQQLSELQSVEGITIVGLLPAPIQAVTTFCAGIATTATDRTSASAFLAFLASPALAELKAAHGMQPA